MRYDNLNVLGQRVLGGIQLRGGREFALTLEGYIRDHQDGFATWLNSSDANKALQRQLSGFVRASKVGDQYTIGQFNEFRLDIRRMAGLVLFQLYDDKTFMEEFTCGEDLVFSSRRFGSWIAKLPEDIKTYRRRVDELTASIKDTEKSMANGGAFPRQEELDGLRVEQKQINEELERLSANTKQEPFIFSQYLEELIEEAADEDDNIEGSLQAQFDLVATL